MTPTLFILIALCGLVIGIYSGLFGVGGGIMIIPLLNLVFFLPVLASAATSLFVVAPTAFSGAYRHYRQGKLDIRPALIIGLSGACASTTSSLFSEAIPEIVILIITAILIVYCALTMIRSAFKPAIDKEGRTSENRFKTPTSSVIAMVALGLFAGSMAGIVGLGGGFVIVPFAVTFFGYSFKQATAVSLFSITMICIPGIIAHAVLGHVWYLYGLALLVGTIPGANIGVRILPKIPEKAIRLVFGILLVATGLLLIARQQLVWA